MYCRNCGTKLEDDALFCTYCGVAISQEQREEAKRAAASSERNVNQAMKRAQYPKREKTFGTTPKSRTIALVQTYILGALGVALLVLYFNSSDWRIVFYETDQYQMWIRREALWEIGAIFVGGAIGSFVLWFELTQIKLCIGQEKISGVAKAGLVTKKFEYYYDEISEVKLAYGGMKIRVDGHGWVTLHRIEDKKLAVEMLEGRIGKNY